MKPHIEAAHEKLAHGCDRAEGLRLTYEYMAANAPAALDCSDILRSSIMLSVSAFDLFVHEIFRLEVLNRLNTNTPIVGLKIPFNAIISDSKSINIVDDCIRSENSYKSFVAPDKVAECLKVLIEKPWERVSDATSIPVSSLKSQLKQVIDLRNRIAHEADVNPNYAGIELWPIYSSDVKSSIDFLRFVGGGIAEAVNSAA